MSANEYLTWRVVGSINGYCTYSKDKLTKAEARHFIENAINADGSAYYLWQDGEMIVATPGVAAFWSKNDMDQQT